MDYRKISEEWYQAKQELFTHGDYAEMIVLNEKYLNALQGKYNEKEAGYFAFQIMLSLIRVAYHIKRYDYALRICVELQKIDLITIDRVDSGEVEFYFGAISYELENYDDAQKYLAIAQEKSNGRSLGLLNTNKYKLFIESLQISKQSNGRESAFTQIYNILKNKEDSYDIATFLINMIKSGFFSTDEMIQGVSNFIEYNYEEYLSILESDKIRKIVKKCSELYSNRGASTYFNKLKEVFLQLDQKGLLALHAVGNTDDDGFCCCLEELQNQGSTDKIIVGYCFYTLQSVFNLIEYGSNRLLLSYGSFNEQMSGEVIGRIICQELECAGFEVVWNGTSDTKIEVVITWDKSYSVSD